MSQPIRFYIDGVRRNTSRGNLNNIEQCWRKSLEYTGINHAVWVYRTDHSLTVVTSENALLYWRVV